MAAGPRLILQVPAAGAVARQLRERAPSGDVVVEESPTDAAGRLDPPDVGEVVLSLPSPEALAREQNEVRRVITGAGQGVEPLVVVIGAASELRDEELASVVDAAGRTSRPVILRIIRDA
jgi:hypothetical protein